MADNAGKVLHMIGGSGATSYAANSLVQKKAMSRAKTVMEKAISEVYSTLMPDKFVAADLGCSSGPNTLLVLTEVMNVIADQYHHCPKQESMKAPEILFFLNDLPGNDFNNVFTCLCEYEEKFKHVAKAMPHYVAAMPGSFYGRIFPSNSVHFFHSAFAVHWLSRAPKELEIKKDDGNIYISETTSDAVATAYQLQFQKDLSTFLRARCEELCDGGRMVIYFSGREYDHQVYGGQGIIWRLLADVLNDIVAQGLIQEEKLRSFYLPVYTASIEEVKTVIDTEGSFCIDYASNFEANWDPNDDSVDNLVSDSVISGRNTAKIFRAAIEPMIRNHFDIEDDDFLDHIFSRFAENVSRYLQNEKSGHYFHLLLLKKKTNKLQL